MDQIHQTDNTYPTGVTAVPDTDPEWGYTDKDHCKAKDCFIICLLSELRDDALKAIN